MKPKWMLILSLMALSIISILIVGIAYFYLPTEEVITRQLLFGVTFQIWGILATILIVQKILDIRDRQRWEVVNKHVFRSLYLSVWLVIPKIFEIYGVKIKVEQSPTIEKFGVEYLNPEHQREWKQRAKQELGKVVKEGSKAIKKNMESWQPSTHKAFSELMEDFKNEINELLESFPHQIPPEFLSVIVDVRELAKYRSRVSRSLTDKNYMKKKGIDYTKMNITIVGIDSVYVHEFLSKLLKLLDILEKNVEPKWK